MHQIKGIKRDSYPSAIVLGLELLLTGQAENSDGLFTGLEF